MFLIREEQMRQLGEQTQQDFVEMMMTYVREQFSPCVEDLSQRALRTWVEQAVAEATRCGVSLEPDAAQLILLFLVFGLEPDQSRPWIRETLDDPELAGIGKVRKLIALARQHKVEGIADVIVYDEMES